MPTNESEPTIATNAARHITGAPRVRGYSVYDDLMGEDYWSQLAVSVGYRPLTPEQCEVFDVFSSGYLLAEPRVWFLRVARMCASFGRFVPGIASCLLLLETTTMTGALRPEVGEFYREYRALAEDDQSDELAYARAWFDSYDGRPPGFWTQARARDERQANIGRWLDEVREWDGPYYRLQKELADFALEEYDTWPNYVAILTAVMLDMGFEPEHVPPFVLTMQNTNALNNVVEASQQESESLRNFPRDYVRYVGPAPRKSPRAGA